MAPNHDGVVKTWPKLLLQAEGAALLGATIWAYSRFGRSWWAFGGLLLLPDLGMVGYASNSVLGAAIYNAFHTETPPILLLCAGLARGSTPVASLALTWLAHIGMDRMFGFGLKYGTHFGHTHLSVIAAPGGKGAKKDEAS